ncbi:Pyrimidine deaminase [Paraburkholderia piptadeniae]|uniref:Pyrimidine deaminase n=1 Tax=Paraburkholderia piptadeniae TaxID=1701573 RepID=A0A1N7S459_9BURK|nr:PP0621 family protein [Paraburkholderia piptadeniae]SIT42116.1 Pyrimidine deaminase [Paraburkholderia piptadeniae]
MRQIFLLILLFIVGQWLVKALRRADSSRTARTGAGGHTGADAHAGTRSHGHAGGGAHSKAAGQLPEPMIRCVECGVHAPKSDSVLVDGQTFCSHDHAKRYAARPAGRNAR